jgi:acyl carrier protein
MSETDKAAEIERYFRKEFAFFFDIDPEKVTLDARLREDLAIYDLDDVAGIIEEEYDDDIPDEDLDWKTVRDLSVYIEQRWGYMPAVEDAEV